MHFCPQLVKYAAVRGIVFVLIIKKVRGMVLVRGIRNMAPFAHVRIGHGDYLGSCD